MKHSTGKTVIQVVGTLVGLYGVAMLGIAPFIFAYASEPIPWFLLVPVAFHVYSFYVACLVWFQFSPLAVRRICGVIGIYVAALVALLFNPVRDSEVSWLVFPCLGFLVAVYFGYRIASDRLSRWLFPESFSGVQS